MPTVNEQDSLASQLLAAVMAKDADAVQALLAAGADANARRVNEPSMLSLAVDSGDARIAGLIAARTQYPDVSDAADFTPFTTAVRNDMADVAHALLDAGLSPFPSGPGAEYPLDWAVANKMYGVITRMLKTGGWPDRLYKDEPLIVHAAKQGDLDLAQACIAAGANVNRGERKHGYTALHLAARQGSEAFINLLLDNGARLDVTANGTQTPYDWAGDNEPILRAVIAGRAMREAARAMTEGTAADISVRRPVRLKRTPGAAP